MARLLDDLPPREALVEIAHDFYARGWMAGTAGNLSVRDDETHAWITASGVPKGRLDKNDFILFRIIDGAVVERLHPQNEPSAETAIHSAIYRLFPEARACLHGHSVSACVASKRARPRSRTLRLPPLEMLKGFDIWKQNPKIDLPLFENLLDVKNIAREITRRFEKVPPALTALMVRDHGPTVWGKSVQDAYNRIECLNFLLNFLAARDR